MKELVILNRLNCLIKPISKAAVQKPISGFRAASIWPSSRGKRTEVDFEPGQQTNNVVLQITVNEEWSAGNILSHDLKLRQTCHINLLLYRKRTTRDVANGDIYTC